MGKKTKRLIRTLRTCFSPQAGYWGRMVRLMILSYCSVGPLAAFMAAVSLTAMLRAHWGFYLLAVALVAHMAGSAAACFIWVVHVKGSVKARASPPPDGTTVQRAA